MKNSTWCLLTALSIAARDLINDAHGANFISVCIFAAALLICKTIEDK